MLGHANSRNLTRYGDFLSGLPATGLAYTNGVQDSLAKTIAKSGIDAGNPHAVRVHRM